MDFTYAHNDTSRGERQTPTSRFNVAKLPAELEEIRLFACSREIPVSCPETLNVLGTLLAALRPAEILEIGTATGLSAAFMHTVCGARITTIEKDPSFAAEARENFKKLNMFPQICLIEGDAAEVLEGLEGPFGFIFLDGPKAQYSKYLPRLKKLLEKGGVLLADDVLLFGYVTGETEVPKKRRSIVGHIERYISAAVSDPELQTSVINAGNGLCMSVKL